MPDANYIQKMFDDISPKYDLLNDLLSFGTHRLWKKKLIKLALTDNPNSVLDCATGTGDIAFLFEKNSLNKIQACDFSEKMIHEANERKHKQHSSVSFRVADISALPYKNDEFDVSTVSFGIRNVENIKKSLQELSRTSRSLFILEFGSPSSIVWKKIYFSVLKIYFPILSVLTNRSDAYEYLISSSETFPSGKDFEEMIRNNTSYTKIESLPLFGGIAYIYSARR